MAAIKASAATPKQIGEARELLKDLRATIKLLTAHQQGFAGSFATLDGLRQGIIRATLSLGKRAEEVASPYNTDGATISQLTDGLIRATGAIKDAALDSVVQCRTKIQELIEAEAKTIAALREENRLLAEQVATCAVQRDSARQQVEKLNKFLDLTVFAPHLYDRLQWALWRIHRPKIDPAVFISKWATPTEKVDNLIKQEQERKSNLEKRMNESNAKLESLRSLRDKLAADPECAKAVKDALELLR